jgi:RNA polymerase-binding transcription factor DksA
VDEIDAVDSDAPLGQNPYSGASSLIEDDGDLGVRDDDDTVLEEGRRLLAEAEAKLAAVERALVRLDAGSYGLCEVCNEPIAPNRLTERPSLARCQEHEITGE